MFFTAVVFFCSCENFDWFKTDQGLDKDLYGTWKREFLGAKTDFDEEDWNFSDGKISIIRKTGSTIDTVDNASYSADAKLTVSYLKISGFTNRIDTLLIQYNNKWTVTQLDSKVLYLVTNSTGGGLIQREFEKK
jgi:hypothetical protein